MQLPGREGADGQEFTLQRSFVPRRKANLAAFIFARNDPGHYGEMVLYRTNDSTALSPAQAASSIESDQVISSQFTLLDQAKSRVIRGDVQLIPIGNTILYVRPIWVEGEGAQTFPHFRFVAAVVGERAVLAANVADAVEALLKGTTPSIQNPTQGGSSQTTTPTTTPTTRPGSTTTTTAPTGGTPTVAELLQRANAEFAAADAALKASDLVGWAMHIQAARELVNQANTLAAAGGGANGSTPSSTTSTTVPVKT
jgi:uncharacterized membrane protein (UPF0182 family)